MNHIDLAAVRRARIAFDMQLVPVWVEAVYMPDALNPELEATLIYVNVYSDASYADWSLLTDDGDEKKFPPATWREFEGELHRHLQAVHDKRKRDREYSKFLADLMRPMPTWQHDTEVPAFLRRQAD